MSEEDEKKRDEKIIYIHKYLPQLPKDVKQGVVDIVSLETANGTFSGTGGTSLHYTNISDQVLDKIYIFARDKYEILNQAAASEEEEKKLQERMQEMASNKKK
jgi:hypothetical protein